MKKLRKRCGLGVRLARGFQLGVLHMDGPDSKTCKPKLNRHGFIRTSFGLQSVYPFYQNYHLVFTFLAFLLHRAPRTTCPTYLPHTPISRSLSFSDCASQNRDGIGLDRL